MTFVDFLCNIFCIVDRFGIIYSSSIMIDLTIPTFSYNRHFALVKSPLKNLKFECSFKRENWYKFIFVWVFTKEDYLTIFLCKGCKLEMS
jgi:hypothetical protein